MSNATVVPKLTVTDVTTHISPTAGNTPAMTVWLIAGEMYIVCFTEKFLLSAVNLATNQYAIITLLLSIF